MVMISWPSGAEYSTSIDPIEEEAAAAVDPIEGTSSECSPDPSLIAEIEVSRNRIRNRLETLANRLAGPVMVAGVVDSDASDEIDESVRSLIEGD